MWAALRRIVMSLAGVMCALIVWAVPVNKYEWMLAEDPELTVKTLPIDHNAGMYGIWAIFPLLVYALVSLFLKSKTEKIVFFSIQGLILLCWLFRFHASLV
jgi:hypothetical protein